VLSLYHQVSPVVEVRAAAIELAELLAAGDATQLHPVRARHTDREAAI
jgi:hypothetical protein